MRYDVEGMKENLAKVGGGGGFWKAPVGNTKVRILPGEVGNCDKGAFYRTIRTHRTDLGEGLRNFKAPTNRWDAFEAAAEIFQSHGMQEQAKSCRARVSFALNLVPDGEKEISIWQCSGKIIKKLVSFIVDEDFGDFTDPETGYCITVNREGEGFSTRYDVIPSKTTGRLPEGWEELAMDLSICDGENIDPKKAIALLATRFESDYDDLSLELMQHRQAHLREVQKRKEKATARKPKIKRKVRRKVTR